MLDRMCEAGKPELGSRQWHEPTIVYQVLKKGGFVTMGCADPSDGVVKIDGEWSRKWMVDYALAWIEVNGYCMGPATPEQVEAWKDHLLEDIRRVAGDNPVLPENERWLNELVVLRFSEK